MSKRDDWTSTYLLSVLRERDEDAADSSREEHPAEIQAYEEFFQLFMKLLIESHQGFSDSKIEKIKQVFEENKLDVEYWLDDHYCKHLLSRIEKFVSRTRRLTPILPKETPSKEINQLLTEASRCYIFGLFKGCVALCRASIELRLHEVLYKQLRLSTEIEIDLKNLINKAFNMKCLNHSAKEMAHRVRIRANKVLHSKRSADETDDAYEVLVCTRGVIAALFE